MKKLLLIFAFVFVGVSSVYSQGDLKLGFNAGIPTVGDFSDLQVGVDAAYLINIPCLAEVGPMVGYSHFLNKDNFNDLSFIPVAASVRIDFSKVFVGLDLGYAIAVQDGSNGGAYYRPKVGLGIGLVNIITSYSGISADGANISSINLGVELSL